MKALDWVETSEKTNSRFWLVWLPDHISERILGKEGHRNHHNQRLQKEIQELGQWPIPPSHLEPHLGPNLEKSVTMHAFKFILILFIILFIHKLMIHFSLHNTIHHFI